MSYARAVLLATWMACTANASLAADECNHGNVDACTRDIAKQTADADKAQAYYWRSDVYEEMGEFDLALGDALMATRLAPTDFTNHLKVCTIYERLEDLLSAEEACTKAIQVEAKGYSYQKRAEIHERLGNARKVVADATQCLQLENANTDCLTLRLKAYVSLKQHNLALSDARRVQAIEPNEERKSNLQALEKLAGAKPARR